jgi:hypothetical protein
MDMSMGDGTRWVTLVPDPSAQTGLTLILANNSDQEALIGRQSVGVPIITINSDDVVADFERMNGRGVCFFGEPKENPYGIDVVFEDLYGNLIDLVQLAPMPE